MSEILSSVTAYYSSLMKILCVSREQSNLNNVSFDSHANSARRSVRVLSHFLFDNIGFYFIVLHFSVLFLFVVIGFINFLWLKSLF